MRALTDDCTSYENYLSELFFADDETLLATNVDDLQTMLSQVQICLRGVGLSISVKTT